nr:hypothetical protein [Tanacetum cinerariifolium]
PEEDKFEEEEDPKEEEDDMEIDIEENKNEPEITYLYVEMDPLNPLLLSLNLMMRSRRLCGRETMHALVEKNRKAKDKFY